MFELAIDEKRSEEKRREAENLVRSSVRIKRVVLILAALEQGTTYLAHIAFLGATVVLLGAPRIKLYDFKVISALLLSEAVRVFLVKKNATANWSRWGGCYGRLIFATTDIFQALQIGGAAVTFAFSLSRLKSGNYKPTLSLPSDAEELAKFVYGIRLFYILTLLDSLVFLVVKVLAWHLLLMSIKEPVLVSFTVEIYAVFLREGFDKASATNFFNFIINNTLEHQKGGTAPILNSFVWRIPAEARTTESIKCLIRLTAHGQPGEIRCYANIIIAGVVLGGEVKNFLLAVPEFGRIPLEVVDTAVIKFLDVLVRYAPLGFLPVEAVSKQASKFLIRSIFEGDDDIKARDDDIKAQAALTFLEWWRIPSVYREYGFDPADIFYRLYIGGRQRVSVAEDFFNLEAALQYEAIAEPIRTVFSQAVPRSDIMNKLLSRVDFSKLKNKHTTINLSGIVAEVSGTESELNDEVVGLVAAWIWFMDESTFEKAISNLTKEELGMLKKNTLISDAIYRRRN